MALAALFAAQRSRRPSAWCLARLRCSRCSTFSSAAGPCPPPCPRGKGSHTAACSTPNGPGFIDLNAARCMHQPAARAPIAPARPTAAARHRRPGAAGHGRRQAGCARNAVHCGPALEAGRQNGHKQQPAPVRRRRPTPATAASARPAATAWTTTTTPRPTTRWTPRAPRRPATAKPAPASRTRSTRSSGRPRAARSTPGCSGVPARPARSA